MDISKDEKRLLKQIYYNNQELIMKICEAVCDELDWIERGALYELSKCIKSKSIRWSYNGETMTNEALVHCIIREQLQKGQSIEILSKFIMNEAPLLQTMISPGEDRYDVLELDDGKLIYVRKCCYWKDVQKLIEELNIEAVKVEG